MFTNPFPQQGFVATEAPKGQKNTQNPPPGTYDYNILMMRFDQPITVDLKLHTRSHQYNKPPSASAPEIPSSSTEPLLTTNGHFKIP